MKIFDYKFLILLGLSLVVYFIYREVEYLRAQVDKLQKELKTAPLLTETKQAPSIVENTQKNKPVLSLPKPLDNQPQPQPQNIVLPEPICNLKIINDKSDTLCKSPPKNISIDMSPSKNYESYESGVKLTTVVNKLLTNSDSDTSNNSSSSKHLAIYSNDNDNDNETDSQNSLIVSINNIESTVNNLIEDASQEESESESEKLKSENLVENNSESVNKESPNDVLDESELKKKKNSRIKTNCQKKVH